MKDAARLETGKERLRTAIAAYWRQIERGRYFPHEHPWPAKSWAEEEMQDLMSDPSVETVKGPMCKWDMVREDEQGVAYIRKHTGWTTNCPRLARILEGECTNVTGEAPWHRHIQLINNKARWARVYPPKLVAAVLRGLVEQMREDGALSALEGDRAGPVPVEPLIPEGVRMDTAVCGYWDDVNGGWLKKDKVEAARHEEIEWLRTRGIWEKVPVKQCLAETGKKPISVRWVDTNKGDDENELYRSRLVVLELRKKNTTLTAAELFSAMPPNEAMKAL